MRRGALLIAAWVSSLMIQPARADECDALTAKIGAATGATIEFRSGADVHFDQPDYRMALFCDARPQKIRVTIDNPAPAAEFFASLGLAGAALTGADPFKIGRAAVACYKAGLTVPNRGAEVLNREFTVSCDDRSNGFQAFIYKEPRPERPEGSCVSETGGRCTPIVD
ncbi:MAG: hypothetical protein QM651_15230 [Rhodoblastus sp.]